jgi:septum formation protein
VIGADQVLECHGKILSKAKNKKAAADKLRFLRGKTHRLISAACVAKNGKIIWQGVQHADLTMKNFNDAFLKRYIAEAGDTLTGAVGAYALEEKGIWLFKKIEGDYFTILGMPLLPLLGFLQGEGLGL